MGKCVTKNYYKETYNVVIEKEKQYRIVFFNVIEIKVILECYYSELKITKFICKNDSYANKCFYHFIPRPEMSDYRMMSQRVKKLEKVLAQHDIK